MISLQRNTVEQILTLKANNTDLHIEDTSQPAVPDSCCRDPFEFCGIILNDVNSTYQIGCAQALQNDIVNHVNVFAIVLGWLLEICIWANL